MVMACLGEAVEESSQECYNRPMIELDQVFLIKVEENLESAQSEFINRRYGEMN